jgi:hypothetical protein
VAPMRTFFFARRGGSLGATAVIAYLRLLPMAWRRLSPPRLPMCFSTQETQTQASLEATLGENCRSSERDISTALQSRSEPSVRSGV